ncbi:MAG: hypothetical protein KAH03_02055 [Cocleimonas sp.]|nr:hypothetical protein [Cocleimonas sp.]
MNKSRSRTNHLVPSTTISIFLTGLLLISLSACEKKDPETIRSELDLNQPSIGSGQFSEETMIENNEQSEINITTTRVIDTKPDLSEPTQQLSRINLKAQTRKVFAENTLLMEDEFYLLGWSADGEKIAYLIRDETDAAALFSVGVYVQDLVSDKIIWGIKKEAELDELNNINDYWTENKQQIMEGLEQHKIIQGNHFTLQNAPISYNGDTFNYTVKTTKVRGKEEIKAYQIFLTSAIKGHKEITKVALKTKGDQLGGKEKVAVIGYFQGSDKARVATLVGLLESGWEGARIVRYKIIGGSLKYGKWRK